MPNIPKGLRSSINHLIMLLGIVVILYFSFFNVNKIFEPERVLGERVVVPDTSAYWIKFVAENPEYLPGWVELDRFDKVMEIDPNYQLID